MKIISGLLKQIYNGQEYECLLCPYAVGDIFITTNELDPAIRYKGTKWQKIEDETFLMSASKKYPIKNTGGENETTLTIENIPPHDHEFDVGTNDGSDATATRARRAWVGNVPGKVRTYRTGGGMPHNNMPKFFAAYFWLRVV